MPNDVIRSHGVSGGSIQNHLLICFMGLKLKPIISYFPIKNENKSTLVKLFIWTIIDQSQFDKLELPKTTQDGSLTLYIHFEG
jgi:hypothetical protein